MKQIQAIRPEQVSQQVPVQSSRSEPKQKVQVDPVKELEEFVDRANDIKEWVWIGNRLMQLHFRVPSQIIYNALKRCNDQDWKKIIVDTLSEIALTGITAETTGDRERGLMRLIQAASFVGRGELLWQMNLVWAAFRDPMVNRPVPVAVKERIAACERFRGGKYSADDLHYAGYNLHQNNGGLQIWLHPDTRDSKTVSMMHKDRLGAKHGDRRNQVDAPKELMWNGAGELIEVKKHKQVVPLSDEDRAVREREKVAEKAAAEQKKAAAAEAQKAKEKKNKSQGGKKKK